MNAQAVELQRRGGSSIISRFHALWSAGSVVGGLLASRAAQIGLELRTQLLITAVVLVGMTAVAARWLLPTRRQPVNGSDDQPPPRSARGRASILLRLLLVGVAVALAEAPPNEWAALMMADRFDLGPGRRGPRFRSRRRWNAHRPPRRRPRHRPVRIGAHSTVRGCAGRGRRRNRHVGAPPGRCGRGTDRDRTGLVDVVPAAVPCRQRPDPRLALRHGGVLVGAPARVPRRLTGDRAHRRRQLDRRRRADRGRWGGRRRRRQSPAGPGGGELAAQPRPS